MSDADNKAELERLRSENDGTRMKVSEKGAVSVLRNGTLSNDVVQKSNG